jgi:hypothetical protein
VVLGGSQNGLQATDGPLPWPRTRDDVRGATQKAVVPRSARRLVSSEAAPAVLAGSQNGLQATDGPPPRPRTRDDLPCATSASFQLAPRLRHTCVAWHQPNSVRMVVWTRRTRSKQKESPQRDSNQLATG